MIPFIFQPTILIINSFLPKLSQTNNNNWSFSLGWAVQLINNRWLEAEGRPLLAPPRHGMTRQPANATEALPHHHSTSLPLVPQSVSVLPLRYVVFVSSTSPSFCRWKCPRVLLCAVSSELCFITLFAVIVEFIWISHLGLQVSLSNVIVILIWRT